MIFNVLNSKFTESRLKYLEEKERLKYFNISDYITFNSGFTACEDSFMRRSGDTIELYLVINGTFTAGTTPHVCTINRLRPYATKTARIFPLVLIDTPTAKAMGFLFLRPLHCRKDFSFT